MNSGTCESAKRQKQEAKEEKKKKNTLSYILKRRTKIMAFAIKIESERVKENTTVSYI